MAEDNEPKSQPAKPSTQPPEQPQPKSPPPVVPDPKTMMIGKKSQDGVSGKETATIKVQIERRSKR